MHRFELWKSGALRGANAFPRHTPEDLRTLRGLGANLVSFGVESVLEFEAPFALKAGAFDDIAGALERARGAGLFATINFRSAPGRKDFNYDHDIWRDYAYHDAFVRMWREVARELRGCGAAGYDLMCEPHPEDLLQDVPREQRAEAMKGTPADWNELARRATEAIREVDEATPIIVNSTGWAYPQTFEYLEPTGDPRTVYSVHYYSPRLYTHQKPEQPVCYPGVAPEHVEPEQYWDAEAMARTLRPVRDFQERVGAPVFSGEFGCARFAPGVTDFFRDQLSLYERWGWSWAYWDLRGWSVMDIELNGDPGDTQRYEETPVLGVFKEFFAKGQAWPKE
jgi:endoglucanase